MHRVFFIREILLDMFEYFLPVPPLDERCHSNPDLAALARTCQTFKEPALDVLWGNLFDLAPLAQCLPEACRFSDGYYSFRSPLSEAEWKILRGYTRRVKSIHQFSSFMRNERIILFLTAFTDPLFPNLRSLYWRDSRTLPVAHIAVPSLASLSLVVIRLESESLLVELFDTIGERCPNVRRFSASFFGSGLLDATISRQLCRWTSLQCVDCRSVTLSTDFILHLPSLSTLERLLLTLSPDLGNHTTHLGSTFVLSNLAELDIRSTSLKSVTNLFSRIQLPQIKDLDVTVSEYTPRLDVQKYWTTVQRACPSSTLARLAFSSLFSNRTEILPGLYEPEGPPCLTLVDLLPYKEFGNLRKIAIDVAWSVNLTDADILDLVSTSPHLEELSINSFWGWKMDREGGITLSGMVQLLRQCPSLGSASLVIDTRTFTRIPPGLDVSFPPRKTYRGTLSLNCSESQFVPEFDAGYASVFKALKLSVWPYGRAEESQDIADE